MVTYILIHSIKRSVLLETCSIELIRAFVDQKVPVDQLYTVELLIERD
jgi:hypothetical protein